MIIGILSTMHVITWVHPSFKDNALKEVATLTCPGCSWWFYVPAFTNSIKTGGLAMIGSEWNWRFWGSTALEEFDCMTCARCDIIDSFLLKSPWRWKIGCLNTDRYFLICLPGTWTPHNVLQCILVSKRMAPGWHFVQNNPSFKTWVCSSTSSFSSKRGDMISPKRLTTFVEYWHVFPIQCTMSTSCIENCTFYWHHSPTHGMQSSWPKPLKLVLICIVKGTCITQEVCLTHDLHGDSGTTRHWQDTCDLAIRNRWIFQFARY